MSKIIVMNNEMFGDVRFVNFKGKPHAVGKDIAEKLGYKNTRDAINRHCKGVEKHDIVDITGFNQQMSIIPEGDIYRLIIKSKLPQAEKFEEWVMEEVLPQIRETGGYIPVEEDESDDELMAKALLIAQKTIDKKNRIIEEKDEQLKIQKPKVDTYDKFVDKDHTLGFRELRKELESATGIKLKENELKDILRELKLIGKTLSASAYAIREGYAVTKDVLDRFNNTRTQDRFTMKCRELVLDYVDNNLMVS